MGGRQGAPFVRGGQAGDGGRETAGRRQKARERMARGGLGRLCA